MRFRKEEEGGRRTIKSKKERQNTFDRNDQIRADKINRIHTKIEKEGEKKRNKARDREKILLVGYDQIRVLRADQ